MAIPILFFHNIDGHYGPVLASFSLCLSSVLLLNEHLKLFFSDNGKTDEKQYNDSVGSAKWDAPTLKIDIQTQVGGLLDNEHIVLWCINLATVLLNQNWNFKISLKFANFNLNFSSMMEIPLQPNQVEGNQIKKKDKEEKKKGIQRQVGSKIEIGMELRLVQLLENVATHNNFTLKDQLRNQLKKGCHCNK